MIIILYVLESTKLYVIVDYAMIIISSMDGGWPPRSTFTIILFGESQPMLKKNVQTWYTPTVRVAHASLGQNQRKLKSERKSHARLTFGFRVAKMHLGDKTFGWVLVTH
jgi:hypothetical protein